MGNFFAGEGGRRKEEKYEGRTSGNYEYYLRLIYDEEKDEKEQINGGDFEFMWSGGRPYITIEKCVGRFTLQEGEKIRPINLRLNSQTTKIWEFQPLDPIGGFLRDPKKPHRYLQADLTHPFIPTTTSPEVPHLSTNVETTYYATWPADVKADYDQVLDYMRAQIRKTEEEKENAKKEAKESAKENGARKDPVAYLPAEIMWIIVGMLDNGRDIVSCMLVNKEWHRIASYEGIPWRQRINLLDTAWVNLVTWRATFLKDERGKKTGINLEYWLLAVEEEEEVLDRRLLLPPTTIALSLVNVKYVTPSSQAK